MAITRGALLRGLGCSGTIPISQLLGRIVRLCCCLAVCVLANSVAGEESRQATGVKVGEVTHDSAIVWMRLTRNATRTAGTKNFNSAALVEPLDGACPGAAGKVRLRFAPAADLAGAIETPWQEVGAATDFGYLFKLNGLAPATTYHYCTETCDLDGRAHAPLKGQFRTSPLPDAKASVTFTIITGQAYRSTDDSEGHRIYASMLELKPDFIVHTGDTVYYDNDPPLANTTELARYHWQRMYSLPRLVQFHLQVPGYWIKDDHETLDNDCWPSMKNEKMKPLTFSEGQRIYREQVPQLQPPYRTFRWGSGLQIWLVEGRDFRSPNNDPDGPGKTIWGPEQKQWLKETLAASDARYRVLISPTPIVGPDRANKGDNHANAAFGHEGREMRAWFREKAASKENFFIACGDRHWQYHSVDPDTGLHEFCCGPATDKHAGGSPGLDERYHRFHRVKGGFLSVHVDARAGMIAFRHHDVDGNVVYQWTAPQQQR